MDGGVPWSLVPVVGGAHRDPTSTGSVLVTVVGHHLSLIVSHTIVNLIL